jgi:hypothetical protein
MPAIKNSIIAKKKSSFNKVKTTGTVKIMTVGSFMGNGESDNHLLMPSKLSKINTALQIALVLFLVTTKLYPILSVVHCRKSAALQKMSFATGFVT